MKTVEMKIGKLDVVVCEVNNDVIAYLKPVEGKSEETVRDALRINFTVNQDYFKHLGLKGEDATPETGANASGWYAVLKWENAVIAEQPKPVKKDNVVVRAAKWAWNRPTDQYRGFTAGVAFSAVVLVGALVVARK